MNKGKLIFLVGLPACGKTTYAKGKLYNYEIFDDFTQNKYSFDSVKEKLSEGINCAIIDAHLCKKEAQEYARKIFQDFDFEMIYFENSLEKCLTNAHSRFKNGDTRKVMEDIKYFNKIYFIPENQRTIKIKIK